jgi:hypothetical protein
MIILQKKLHSNFMKNKKVQILNSAFVGPFQLRLSVDKLLEAVCAINPNKKTASKLDEKLKIHMLSKYAK